MYIHTHTRMYIYTYMLLEFFPHSNRLILCVDIKNQDVFSRLLQIAMRYGSVYAPKIS